MRKCEIRFPVLAEVLSDWRMLAFFEDHKKIAGIRTIYRISVLKNDENYEDKWSSLKPISMDDHKEEIINILKENFSYFEE